MLFEATDTRSQAALIGKSLKINNSCHAFDSCKLCGGNSYNPCGCIPMLRMALSRNIRRIRSPRHRILRGCSNPPHLGNCRSSAHGTSRTLRCSLCKIRSSTLSRSALRARCRLCIQPSLLGSHHGCYVYSASFDSCVSPAYAPFLFPAVLSTRQFRLCVVHLSPRRFRRALFLV